MKPANDVREIDILPDPSLLMKLGRANFTLGWALGEFVDNAYDARGSQSPVLVDIYIDPQTRTIEIRDNASGMSLEDLRAALTIGKSSKRADTIGIFGIGLKAAATFLADEFAISTTRDGGDQVFSVRIDLNSFDAWRVPVVIKPREPEASSGTTITLSRVRVDLGRDSLSRAREELSEVYHRLIQKEKLIISTNGEPIKPLQLDLMPDLRWDINLKVGMKNVRGWVAAARPVRQGGQNNYTPGFYLVRHDRVVKKGVWIGHPYHSRLRTMVGEIELDDFEVNANKTDFLKDTPEWVQLDQGMKQFFAENRLVTQIYKGISGKKKDAPVAEAGKPEVTTGEVSSAAPSEPPMEPPPFPGHSPSTFPSAVGPTAGERPPSIGTPKRVFIIHGRDQTARDQCVNLLQELGVEPVVLEQVPSVKLQPVLDKLDHYVQSCDYFIVLLTPDDRGYCPLDGESSDKARPRARQNVIFELGYVAKKRARVMLLVKKSEPRIEIPSDVQGIAYHEFESDLAGVKEHIIGNLQHAGLLPTNAGTPAGTP